MIDPDRATPYPDTPRFFKYVWRPISPGYAIGHDLIALLDTGSELVIYGFSCRSSYSEDWWREDQAFNRLKQFPAWCFSGREPEGECGFAPLVGAIEMTEEEFRKAQQEGWPNHVR